METTPIRVMWFVPPLLAIVAAENTGALLAVGERNRSSDEQFENLVSGKVEAVVTSMDNVIGWNSRPGPKDFRVVAQIEQTTPLSLVARNGLSGIQDLRGANILVDAPDNGFVIALKAMLRESGVAPNDYRLTAAGGVKERYDALLEGQGDATLLGPPFDGMAAAAGQVRIATIQDKYPAFPGQGVVMRMGCARRADVAAWLGALERARFAVDRAPESALEAARRAGLSPQAAQAMTALNPGSLKPTKEGIDLLIGHRGALGLLGGDEDWNSIVDEAILESIEGASE
ncbi:ABC-type nitrate/sulfonate/bicarbonate transport system substrate-binding protein [Paraburkholderia sp. WC7.3g]|uniref:ABC transporter substrate-binding protein n=1 Tax=Paraburkholderia sp. WC7.3g TaxID=2991070 RepID=UPI003D1BC3B9